MLKPLLREATTGNDDVHASLFRHGASDRQRLTTAALQADCCDQKPWGLMYQALVQALGASPDSFQLLYPCTAWDWPAPRDGFIDCAQYDFCSTVPHWSAIGAYASSGDRLHQAYREFLNIVPVSCQDGDLRQQLRTAEETLTQASNSYTITYNQARSAYLDEVKDNSPSFSAWLGQAAGRGWQTRIATASRRMDLAQIGFDLLVRQADNLGLAAAQTQAGNAEAFARLDDPELARFPMVPAWTVAAHAGAWRAAVQAGSGPGGGTLSFSSDDAGYDFQKTWAGGAASIKQWFWALRIDGRWQRVDAFDGADRLQVDIAFEALELIPLQPGAWYDSAFVQDQGRGPFTRGYSAYGGDLTQAVFGKDGFLGLRKTGMYVGYRPSFSISTDAGRYPRFAAQLDAATGLRIGPLAFEAEGGAAQAGWQGCAQTLRFSGTTTSTQPLIVGITVAQLPNDA